jgi:Phosphotransferase enzyme family
MTAPVPDTLEMLLSPDWLSLALEPRFPGIRVTRVTPGPLVSRVSMNARFRIECADGVPAGLSPDLCGKGYFGEAGKAFRHVGESEACFYRDAAEATGMRTLRSVYAGVDPVTRHGVVITEDVVAQGATFLDARSDYSQDQAAESLGELAKLHAATWENPVYAEAPWLDSRLESYLLHRGVADIRGNFDGPIGAGIPVGVRDAQQLFAAFQVLATDAPKESPWSVIHGDAHVGNVYLDGDRRPSFVDWQTVQRGPWYIDVGYHLASALTVAARRQSEEDLVRHYLQQLAAAGVQPPSLDDAWRGVRRGITYGFFMWAITLKVNPAITTLLLERIGTAAADHEVFSTPV